MNLFFPAFFDNPTDVKFDTQEPDERIELLLRRHGITNLGWIILAIVLLALPGILPYLQPLFAGAVPTVGMDITTAMLIIWYLLVIAYVVENYLKWYFSVYIVTNKHLLDVNFYNLLNRDIVSMQIVDVQAVKPKVKGVFGSLFYYGDLTIESAAKGEGINFEDIPKPDVVADRIQDLQEIAEKGDGGSI